MQEFEERECENKDCIVVFKPSREWQLYCSVLCRTEDYAKRVTTIVLRTTRIIQCPECGCEIDLKQFKEKK